MQRPTRRRWAALRTGDALVVVAAAAALASALWSASLGLERMNVARTYYASLEQAEREAEIELALGFDHRLWSEIRRAVRDDDRFVVVSDAFEQHEVRNYAAYSLLPAIQVSSVEDATVVIYWANEPPVGSPCVELGRNVCAERRDRS